MADVVKVEREMIGQIVDAGCRYVHIDEPGFTAYADEASLEVLRSRGDDPAVNRQRSIAANNALIAGFPDDVDFGIHLCRGNRESQWHREGSYDAIAEQRPRRPALRPPHARVRHRSRRRVRAAAVRPRRRRRRPRPAHHEDAATSRRPTTVKRRIDEASAYLPLERLALSPQCGFASASAATSSARTTSGASSSWCCRSPRTSGAVARDGPRGDDRFRRHRDRRGTRRA